MKPRKIGRKNDKYSLHPLTIYSKIKEKISRIFTCKHESNWRRGLTDSIFRDAANVLNACVQADLPVEQDKESIDMCEAIQTMKKQAAKKAAEKATEKTFIETCKDLGETFMDTASRAARKFHLSDAQAEALVKKYW